MTQTSTPILLVGHFRYVNENIFEDALDKWNETAKMGNDRKIVLAYSGNEIEQIKGKFRNIHVDYIGSSGKGKYINAMRAYDFAQKKGFIGDKNQHVCIADSESILPDYDMFDEIDEYTKNGYANCAVVGKRDKVNLGSNGEKRKYIEALIELSIAYICGDNKSVDSGLEGLSSTQSILQVMPTGMWTKIFNNVNSSHENNLPLYHDVLLVSHEMIQYAGGHKNIHSVDVTTNPKDADVESTLDLKGIFKAFGLYLQQHEITKEVFDTIVSKNKNNPLLSKGELYLDNYDGVEQALQTQLEKLKAEFL